MDNADYKDRVPQAPKEVDDEYPLRRCRCRDLGCAFAAQVDAATYDWTFTANDAGQIASGTLTTSDTVNPATSGGYDVLSITGTGWGGVPITGLIPPSSPGTVTFSPSGYFIFDNLLYAPAGPPTHVDNDGLLFAYGPGTEANIYGNSSLGIGAGSDTYYVNNGANVNGTFAVSAVPLPAALPLFGTVMAGLGLYGWRRKKKLAA